MLRNVVEILSLSCQNTSVYHLLTDFLGKLWGKKIRLSVGGKSVAFFFLLKVLYLIKLLQFVVHHTSMLQTAANKYVVRTERGFKNCIVSSSFTHLSMCTLFFFPNILVVVQMWLLKSVTKKGFMVFDFPSCPNPSPAHNVRRSPVGEA